MSVFAIEHRAALDGKAPINSVGLVLHAQPEGHVLHILSTKARDGSAEALITMIGCDALAVRAISPGQWFMVGDEPMLPAALAELANRLKPIADVVDQSHGRVRMAISGTKMLSVLAKSTAADLSKIAFPIGHATTTLFGHISAHVTRMSENTFELMALRGFAESLWNELVDLSAEYC
ncbi:MAG: sarcosine oxidase subunit gamma [Mesorhizobium sp.]|uniref:sarcosine oxidase subunit gamma family protein n=1 Tax=unclassified Mesorhizobium TaxID=325217 RepID=UPI000FC9CD2E|nr:MULTISPECIES: sarcosine oxidase subunit gamma family protein [unclassified Mesorhizobium]RUW82303.1 sarcosine oxidase subunit gamma [Mesorhizobium sp. M1E.F.Ca.ET.063.01.1.1]TIW10970.1 MAG: sarcosine oxidase subunit gamma [Mesorhizobium sp.]